MGKQVQADREFWHTVLLAGGFTAIPRWTLDPMTGVGEHEATIPDDVAAASARLAKDLAVPLESVLLAAHAKVLAALSGEHEVATGYVTAQGGRPLPCRLRRPSPAHGGRWCWTPIEPRRICCCTRTFRSMSSGASWD